MFGHELSNPLAPIITGLEVLRRKLERRPSAPYHPEEGTKRHVLRGEAADWPPKAVTPVANLLQSV